MTYSTGIIGTGFVAGQHAQAYDTVDDIELAAICDIDEDNLAEFGKEWSVPAGGRYLGHETMLADADLDVVSVTTPSLFHRDHVVAAAQAGVEAIWCEKPIALSVSDAEEMVEVCADRDVDLVVNHHRRFSEAYAALRQEIEAGLLGTVEAATFRGGRELMRNGTHTVDLFVFALGAHAERVSGYLTGEHGMRQGVVDGIDDAYDDAGGGGTVVTTDGTYVTVDHTLPRAISAPLVDFVGTEGRLAVDGGDWRYWRLDETEWEYETPHESTDLEHVEADLPFSVPTPDPIKRFENVASHLVALVEGREENRSPGREAAHVLEILVAMFVSHYTGSSIALPLDLPLRDVEITSW